MAFISVADEVAKKSTTSIENKFITKYLPVLDPVAVKVYLFALYVYQNAQPYTIEDFAEKLSLSEDQAKQYFSHLEEFELVSITSTSPFEIKILDCENVYGSPKKLKPEKYAAFSTEVQSAISGRMISTNEFLDYYYLLEEYGFEQNALLMIINYCVNLKGDKIRSQYIKKVAQNFAEDGIVTAKKVEEKLSAYTSATPSIVTIFSALSISRRPDVDDDAYYGKWTNDLGFSDQAIICAGKHFKAKSMEKLDEALLELYKNRKFDVKEIEDYCKNRNSLFAAARDVAQKLGVYMQSAAPYVENYISVWCNYGFETDTLRIIAGYCFIQDRKTFESMNEFVVSLYDQGIVTEDAVKEKLTAIAAEDKLIKNILNACGLTRKIIPLDRECLKRWRDWNFSDEMLLVAAEKSQGKNNPVAYMNTVLSSWKAEGIFSTDKIRSAPKPSDSGSKKAIIERHYYDLRAAAKQRAEKALAKAMADEIYGDIKRQLSSLSIQLAFAEINDEKSAAVISERISDLETRGDQRLKELGINKEQFKPQYRCKICNDTGYDSEGRQCECLKRFIKSNNL
ncbi:MAG: DnaD domain protein [Candidatus Coproplasma sp.]